MSDSEAEYGRTLRHADSKAQAEIAQNDTFGVEISKTETGDWLYSSQSRTEVDTYGERVPSALLVSSEGKSLIAENPGLLRGLFEGNLDAFIDFPDEDSYKTGAESKAFLIDVNHSGNPQRVVVKVHDEGSQAAYPKGVSRTIFPDHITGYDNFNALRAIKSLSRDSHITAPEPLFATRRLFVTEYVEGKELRMKQVPAEIRKTAERAIAVANQRGWIAQQKKERGFFSKKTSPFSLDLESSGNVIFGTEGKYKDKYVVLDPITTSTGRLNEAFASLIRKVG